MKATDPIIGKQARKFIKTIKKNPEKGKHKLFQKLPKISMKKFASEIKKTKRRKKDYLWLVIEEIAHESKCDADTIIKVLDENREIRDKISHVVWKNNIEEFNKKHNLKS